MIITTEHSSTIAFEDESVPHVSISWADLKPQCSTDQLYFRMENLNALQPSNALLDEDMCVVLKSSPDTEIRECIRSDNRHPLLEYGAKYLRRLFNAELIINNLDRFTKNSLSSLQP